MFVSCYSSCVRVLLTAAVNINVSLTYMHYVIRFRRVYIKSYFRYKRCYALQNVT